jgi:hypothetical protein
MHSIKEGNMANHRLAPKRKNTRERKCRAKASRRHSRNSFKTLNLQMAERFRSWLAAQKYAASTEERYA